MKTETAIKKPIPVEFIRLDNDHYSIAKCYKFVNGEEAIKLTCQMAEDAWYDWCNARQKEGFIPLKTLESGQGTQNANFGDYILKGIDGECWPIKADIFERTYNVQQNDTNVALLSKPAGAVGEKTNVVCYCGSLRVALEAFKKAEYEAVLKGEIALLPCCMFVDIQREYGAESTYKAKADDLHKRKIDICDEVKVLNVDGYIGDSTKSEILYALSIGKTVKYLDPEAFFNSELASELVKLKSL